ncbi:hypothetical protein M413DRAFT_442300 [Hebeloma cylindrosporum]|uniref:Uncharacterized protein n=1 Tax=Hebeloma cylindrosporum TaxID=76867 RepID=A0A0C3CA33_HEBCY|nr:hypothetical protein M413DRAFT_442300 [Hebeloma cylindrosporum h7]
MSIANSQSLDIELPVLNSSSRLAPSDSSLDHGLQLPNQSDDNPTLRADRTLNLIDPPLPAYTPSAPATPIRPGASARALELDDELLRYTLTHDRGGVPVSRLPESFPTDDGQSFRSRETLPPYGANDPPIYRRRIVNSEGEPKTLAMLFFKFGFCAFLISSRIPICPNQTYKFYSLSSLLGFRRPDAYHASTLTQSFISVGGFIGVATQHRTHRLV